MILKNGNMALSGEKDFRHLDLKIEQERISQIGQNLSGENVIDTVEMLIIPDKIDPHVLGFFGDVSRRYLKSSFQENQTRGIQE